MKDFYHICMTAHSEVLLRSMEDVALFTNQLALSAYRNETEVLTDAQMSTHVHETVLCDIPRKFVWSQELSLTKSYNKRHFRRGPLFDGKPFILQIKGPRHMQMAMNYSLRQGLHHGQSDTAFSYPWSTCNQLFKQERGVLPVPAKYCSRSDLKEFFPKNAGCFPDNWQADESGILLRSCFEEISLVENWYGTARSFIYSMTRKTTEEWLEEQKKDDVEGPIISLELMEKGFSSEDISQMKQREGNTKYNTKEMSDMEICSIIDNQMLGRFHKQSVYQLSADQKARLAEELRHDMGLCSEKQIRRCLVMDYVR